LNEAQDSEKQTLPGLHQKLTAIIQVWAQCYQKEIPIHRFEGVKEPKEEEGET